MKKSICLCGCGEEVKIGNKYINGHNTRGKKNPEHSKWMKKNNPMKKPEVRAKISGENNPMKRPENRAKFIGENNPAKRPEVRLKISKNNAMKRPEILEKFIGKNNPMYGKKRPDISGEKHPCKRPDIRQKFSGENHYNWKGGIACEPYCDVWSDQEYKESIKERDGYKCINPTCNGVSKTLCLHHINYIKKDCHPLNLATLCNSCNSKANKDREWHESWYSAIIFRRYIWRENGKF